MGLSSHALALVGGLCACSFFDCQSATVDVVVAHHSEDLSWTEEYKHPNVSFQVYSKAKQAPNGSVTLPNVGRDAHTHLWHIVRKYHHLADWTVFTRGARPSWGYHGSGDAHGHLSDEVGFHDYLKPFPDGRDAFFVLSSASHFPSAMQTNRLGFVLRGLRGNATGKATCPPRGADGWTPWWWDQDHPQLRGKASDVSMLEFYRSFIAGDGSPRTDSLILAFAQGARFAVSRDRVHARPREYYAALLEQLARSEARMENYWMEAAWYDVFHPEALQSKHGPCELPRVPTRQNPLTVAAMQAQALHRAQEGGFLDADGEKPEQIRFLSVGYGSTTANGASGAVVPASFGLLAPLAALALAASGLVAHLKSA